MAVIYGRDTAEVSPTCRRSIVYGRVGVLVRVRVAGVQCTVVLPALPVHVCPIFEGVWPFQPLLTLLAHKYDEQKEALANTWNAKWEKHRAKLREKLEAAEARKAEVRYPPCARVKATPSVALTTKTGAVGAIKAVFAGLMGYTVAAAKASFSAKFWARAATAPFKSLMRGWKK